jgi:hypothetical protein
MDYPEPLATLGTSDTGRRQTKHNTENLYVIIVGFLSLKDFEKEMI